MGSGTVTRSQLSPAEAARVIGFLPIPRWVELDSTLTPLITAQRDLPVVRPGSLGVHIGGRQAAKPILDLRGTRGLVAEGDLCDFANLVLYGGDHSIHITQSNAVFGSVVESVDFHIQTSSGLRVDNAQSGGHTLLFFEGLAFQTMAARTRRRMCVSRRL